jgi:hypothetical protein
MTSILPIESVERDQGYRRLPRGPQNFLLRLFDSGPRDLIHAFRKQSIPMRPVVVLERLISANAALINFGDSQKIVIALSSLPPLQQPAWNWFDNCSIEFGRDVQMIVTTGLSNAHEEVVSERMQHRLLAFDLHRGESAVDLIARFDAQFKVVAELSTPLPDRLFDVLAAHGGWYSHCFAEKIFLVKPIGNLLDYLVELETVEAGRELKPVDYTAVISLRHRQNGDSKPVHGVAIDLFLYAADPKILWSAQSNLKGIRAVKTHPVPSGWGRIQFRQLRMAELKYVSIIVEPLFNWWQDFEQMYVWRKQG